MADLAFDMLPPATRLVGLGFGVSLPRDVCRAESTGERAALWQGPDEWLLIAPDGEGPVLMTRIANALGDEPASVVDVSHRNVAIAVSGARVMEALAGFNALDLDLAAFPVGMCTRTLFGKAEIVLWRTAADACRIEVWRSFAPYVLGCLTEAGRAYAG